MTRQQPTSKATWYMALGGTTTEIHPSVNKTQRCACDASQLFIMYTAYQ